MRAVDVLVRRPPTEIEKLNLLAAGCERLLPLDNCFSSCRKPASGKEYSCNQYQFVRDLEPVRIVRLNLRERLTLLVLRYSRCGGEWDQDHQRAIQMLRSGLSFGA